MLVELDANEIISYRLIQGTVCCGKLVKGENNIFSRFRIDFGAKPKTPAFAEVPGTRYI